jgi:hypothetical protein
VTPQEHDEVVRLLEQYRAGIDAELNLLQQLTGVAEQQHEVSRQSDFGTLAEVSDARDDLMRSLVALEEHLRGVRQALAANRDQAQTIPGYAEVAQRHLQAVQLVNQILGTDRQSMSALADAELARRSAVVSLERGETTLAAYRRVLSPPVANASLVDKIG